MNILLFIHFIVALLLVAVVMLQKTSVDGVSTLSGSNMGLMNIASTNAFLVKTTYALATIFILNSILLANVSSNYRAANKATHTTTSEEMHKELEDKAHNNENSTIPVK